MPLKSAPTAWWNLPGIVAAYQPIAAPGPLIARYNQAHGGDNRFKATDGTAVPSWTGAGGWYFLGSSSQYLVSNINFLTYGADVSYVIAGKNLTTGTYFGNNFGGFWRIARSSGSIYFGHGGQTDVVIGSPFTGTLAVSGQSGYRNGLLVTSIATGEAPRNAPVPIGCTYTGLVYNDFTTGYIGAVLVVDRSLSAAEVWSVSRQMAYCEKNPDWSAWGRRRKWYLSPSVAAAGNYDDATTLARTDAINQTGNLVINAEVGAGAITINEQLSLARSMGAQAASLAALADTISLGRSAGTSYAGVMDIQTAIDLNRLHGILTSLGATTYNESISLARTNSLDLLGWLGIGGSVSLGKNLALDVLGGLALSGAITLSDQRGVGVDGNLILSEAVSLARSAGISETVIQILVGEVNLARSAGISETTIGQYVESLLLGYVLAETQTGVAHILSDLSLGKSLTVAQVLEVFSAVITAVCRIYVVPAEDREYTPLDSLVYVVPAEDRIVEAGCPTQ